MGSYYNDEIGYYEGSLQNGDTVVPVKPEPREEYKLVDLEIENPDGTFGKWIHDPSILKKGLGNIPTRVFMSEVFAAPEGTSNPDQYAWSRWSSVCWYDPGISQKIPIDGYVHGSAAEIQGLAYIYLTMTRSGPDWVPVETPGVGSVISQTEFDAIMRLVTEYGVK